MAKNYKYPDHKPLIASEPAVAYHTTKAAVDWNPNRPVHATQEEWWEHIHQIEQGKFYTIEEADKEFEEWKKEYLASRLL